MTGPITHLDTIVETLLSCLCEAVSGAANPPQNCCLRVGEEVVADADLYTDLCCEGLAYVSLGEIYPVVDSFPEHSIVTQANQVCNFPSWAISLKMGIIRCIPTGTDTTMPTCADWTAAAMQQLVDAQSLARAACCFKASWIFSEPGTGMSVVIGSNIGGQPEGGCIERSVSLQVQTINCGTC